MDAEDKKTLDTFWGNYGTAELIYTIAEVVAARRGGMPDGDWAREIDDLWRALNTVAAEFDKPCRTRENEIWKKLVIGK